MKIVVTTDKSKIKPYPIKIHNKNGEITGELYYRSIINDFFDLHIDYPPTIEKWAWFNSKVISKIYEHAWRFGILKDTSDSAKELYDKIGGSICFVCQKTSVRPYLRFKKLCGYYCTTKNCIMHEFIIPKTLVYKIDEIPDYSLEPEYPQLLNFIKSMDSKSKQLFEQMSKKPT